MTNPVAESGSAFTVEAGEMSTGFTGLEWTSLMFPPSLRTAAVTTAMSNHPEINIEPEKPLDEYVEVKIAVWIDRIYVPVIVGVGILGNVLCFLTLLFTSLRSTSTCVYMAAIAVLDCVILVTVLGFLITGYVGDTVFYLRSDWACGLHYFLFFFSIHFDVLILLAMTVDRFIVVKFPLRAQSLCTPKSAIRAIAGLGVFSFALNFQILFNRGLVPTGRPEDPLWCWYPDADVKFFMTKVYTWIDASIYSFIPFLALLVLNLLIIRQLKQSIKFGQQFTDTKLSLKGNTTKTLTERNSSEINTSTAELRTEARKNVSTVSGGAQADDGGDGSTTSTKKTTNVTLMLLLVSFTFLLLTSPTVIMLLYKRYQWLPSTASERARARLTHAVVDNLMYSNHAVNFLLYCISGRRFRQEFQRLLARFCCRS